MKNKEIMSIRKMIENIDKALKYTEGYTFETFCEDMKTIDATVFAVSQIGELAKNIEKDTAQQYQVIDWRAIKNLRNKIVHDYEGINLKMIWYIVENDIIELRSSLESMIRKEN